MQSEGEPGNGRGCMYMHVRALVGLWHLYFNLLHIDFSKVRFLEFTLVPGIFVIFILFLMLVIKIIGNIYLCVRQCAKPLGAFSFG